MTLSGTGELTVSWGVLEGVRGAQGRPASPSGSEVIPLLVEVRVQSLGLDQTTNTPVVLLQEMGGSRVLPIWIGPSEARAIAMQLADMKFARPLTHDLFCSLLKGVGARIRRVVVTRVEDSTYYAELVVEKDGEVVSIDARPSDSIAVALRVGAQVFVQEDLLDVASVEIKQAEELHEGTVPPGPGPSEEGEKFMGPEELQEYLRKLNPEDFGRFTP